MYNTRIAATDEVEPDRQSSAPPTTARAARPFQNRSVRRAMLGVIGPRFNPLVMKLAVGRRLQSVAMVYHRGRRSGRSYATPTSARPTSDGFVIAMTFGPESDWVQNILAAGGCEIDWQGSRYTLVDPEIVDWASARTAFSTPERILLRAIGMTSFVRLRRQD